MAAFTLDQIRTAAHEKFASLDVTLSDGSQVQLLNALRLSKEKRDALVGISDRLEDEDADQVTIFEDAIRAAADTALGAEKLIGEIDKDLSVLAELFGTYSEGTQAGEASASES